MNPTSKIKPTAYALKKTQALRDSQLKLTRFKHVLDAPSNELWDTIRYFYSSRDLVQNAMATIINGVDSNRKHEFFLSRNLLEEYLRADPNLQRRSLNGSENQKVMHKLLAQMNQVSFLKCLKEPEKVKTGGRGIAGLYTLGDQELTKMMPWWPTPTPHSTPSPTPSPTTVYVNVDVYESEYVNEDEYVQASENLVPTEAELVTGGIVEGQETTHRRTSEGPALVSTGLLVKDRESQHGRTSESTHGRTSEGPASVSTGGLVKPDTGLLVNPSEYEQRVANMRAALCDPSRKHWVNQLLAKTFPLNKPDQDTYLEKAETKQLVVAAQLLWREHGVKPLGWDDEDMAQDKLLALFS